MASTAHALPSNLDTSFGYENGVEGYTRLSYVNTGIWLTQIKDLVVDADGKIVMVGEAAVNSTADKDILVARYNNDGTPDTGFGTNGYVLFDVAGDDDAGYDIIHTGGGKYLIAGTSQTEDVVLVRVNADGSPDTSFSTDGIATWNKAGPNPPIGLTELSDGTIVIAKGGYMAWFNNTGDYIKEDYSSQHGGSSVIRAHTIGGTERLYTIGTGFKSDYPGGPNTATADMAIFATNTDGTPDTSFGTDGVAFSGQLNGNSNARLIFTDIAFDSQDRIVGLGYENFEVTGNTKQYNIYVVRFMPDGQLDTSFNADDITFGGGITKINGPTINGYSKDKGHALVVQNNDKILIAGESGQNSSAVARLNADGTPDVSFASNGLATVLPYGTAAAYAIGLQPDGRISVAGGDKENGPKNPVVFQLVGDQDPNADTTPPSVLGYYPTQDSAIDPDSQQWVGVIFDEVMDYATLDGSIAVSCNDGGTMSGTYQPNYTPGGINYTLLLNLDSKLPYEASCTATLSGSVTDISGNALGSAHAWDFTTTPAPAADTTPDSFSFAAQTGVDFATELNSNTVTITGINTAADISVSNGSYSIGCDGGFTTATGTIGAGDSVCVSHTSAATCLTSVTTQLTVGGVVADFVSTTGEPMTDTDGDGVSDCVDSAPGDNTVASPRTGSGDDLLIATQSGTLAEVEILSDPSIAGVVPANATFPYGALSYNVANLNPGDTVTVSIDYPSLSSNHTVYKCCDQNGAYYAYGGASISGNTVTLTLTDGGVGDADGLANGTLVDPIAITSMTTGTGTGTISTGSGGGGSSNPFILLILGLIPLGKRLLSGRKD